MDTEKELMCYITEGRGIDAISQELYKELLETAIKYVSFRYYWNLFPPEKKASQEKWKEKALEDFHGKLQSYCRYITSQGQNTPTASIHAGWDIQMSGDFACYMVYYLSMRQK